MARTFSVLGMSCDGCANSVTKAIQATQPEATVEVNLETKEITVEGADDNDLIRQAVETAGFEVGGLV
jgi:copper chaperone